MADYEKKTKTTPAAPATAPTEVPAPTPTPAAPAPTPTPAAPAPILVGNVKVGKTWILDGTVVTDELLTRHPVLKNHLKQGGK